MKKILLPVYIIFLISSCGSKSDDSSAKQKELELKAKELELKEKELKMNKSLESSKNDVQSEEIKSSNISNEKSKIPSQMNQPRKKTDFEIAQDLYKAESSNPRKYISATISWKVNLAANTILNGTVYNSAEVTGYQDIEINVSFYSKQNEYLGSEVFTVYDYVNPGSSLEFKHKIKGWWSNVGSSNYEIIKAFPVQTTRMILGKSENQFNDLNIL
jgi:hypothetical protein